MFFAQRTESAQIYYAQLEILELSNIYKLRIALFVHKIKKIMIKKRYSSYFLRCSYTSI